MKNFRILTSFIVFTFTAWLAAMPVFSQQVSLGGRVTDPSGAVVPSAAILLQQQGGKAVRQNSSELGAFEFLNLAPGIYSLRVTKPGFSPYSVDGIAVRGPVQLDVQLAIAAEAQSVTVEDETNQVSVDPASNAGAILLREADLKSFSDDPEELAAELQALAGPGAGPNGGQIYIDGFTGGKLPPKSAIREVRINQNPYSAEFDRIGFGRIEILTKPGADQLRGDAFFGFSDESINSRNPFTPAKAPYQARSFGMRLSGPLTKKSSFGIDVDGRDVSENAVINATILNTELAAVPFRQAVLTPMRRLNVSPRFDYQISDRHTLVARYNYNPGHADNRGVGEFSLLSRAFNTRNSSHTVQVTETAVLTPRAINETRFQSMRSSLRMTGDNTEPAINVLDAFSGGGPQVGLSRQTTSQFEVQNLTTFALGAHSIKFGGRLRAVSNNDYSPNNFGGTFNFAGGIAAVLDAANRPVMDATGQLLTAPITSLERYRRTLLFQSQGLSPARIRALGGGASQFSINGGSPLATLSQADVGLFTTWDWRARPNLTFSAGLRWEDQTNISNHNNFAPRLGLAWAIDGGPGKASKTVLRLGAGIFYDRVEDNLTLQTLRFNGVNQLSYIVPNPDFYPAVPSLDSLAPFQTTQVIRQLAADLRTPYLIQSSIGIERQLPAGTTVAFHYVMSRGVHLLRTRNDNAPRADGSRPLPQAGNRFVFESTGFSRQNQLMTNFNTRFHPRVSLFGFYMFGYARSDTDGAGSLPADNYDLSTEWGPSAFDVRHRFVLGGSVQARWGLSLNPFLLASTGRPFNITSGRDLNGDTSFNDRPALAVDPLLPGVIRTQWGNFLLQPASNDGIIPRNYGRGPGQFSLNLRLGKTWGFGEVNPGPARQEEGSRGPGLDGPPPGGGPGGRGPGGGPRMMGGGPGGRGGFGGPASGKRYNLTLSVMAMNLLNHVNLSAPNGNLSSPLFGQSTQLAGGFGPGGGSAAANRRIELQLRFSF